MTDQRPAHSPLGASSAERWMNCPGSVGLIANLKLEPSDEPDYRREGIAMHEAAAHCLVEQLDAWEIAGETFYQTKITAEMATAIQVYLDAVRPSMGPTDSYYIEYGICQPKIHEQFYGRLDFGSVTKELVDITDLKGGEGIVVEPEENPQLMYYAFGLLANFDSMADDFPVRLRIVQPRAFHAAGPVREWMTTVGFIRAWVRDHLVPAMERTAFDTDLDPGPWCRFCPAKLVCPMLTSLFKAAATADAKAIVNMTDDALGRSYQYTAAVKHYLKAMEDEAYKRLNMGKVVPGTKLVAKRANRVWTEEAPALAEAKFGANAMTVPELKSPAELEKLGAAAKAFVKEYAFMPQTGLTVALDDDKRPAVKVEPGRDVFQDAVKALQ